VDFGKKKQEYKIREKRKLKYKCTSLRSRNGEDMNQRWWW
jgi:hypothetical protein